MLIRRGGLVCAALPLSSPGPCRTGQAEALVQALQQSQGGVLVDVGWDMARAGARARSPWLITAEAGDRL
jgi:hypothetical protein